MKYTIIILLALLLSTSCTSLKNKTSKNRSVSSIYPASLLGITESEGERTLFGIKWNDMYNQNLFTSEMLKNPLQDLVIKDVPNVFKVHDNYEDLIKLIERNLTFRAKAVAFLDEIKKQRKIKKLAEEQCVRSADNRKEKRACRDKKTVMTPDQTDRLTKGAKEFLLLRYLNVYATKLYESKAEKIYAANKKELTNLSIHPGELVEIFMGFAAGLTLYDNYVLMVKQFESDAEIGRIFKQGVETLGLPYDSIKTISRNSRKLKYRMKIAKMVRWIKANNFQVKADVYNDLDKSYNYLLTYINSTAAYKIFNTNVIKLAIYNFGSRITGNLINLYQDLVGIERTVANELSETFGNTVGLIEARKGYLYIGANGKTHKKITDSNFQKVSLAQRKALHLKVREMLEPGDVLLEKTPFRLTDKFIPGHWGHVAIWTGTITDLKEKGLWQLIMNMPEWISLRDDQKKYIEESLRDNPSDPVKDRAVLEALRPGVQLNDLYHFFNVDDIAILKPKLQGKTEFRRRSELANIIAKGFSHVLKDYDFNFDVRDTNKIVCSELAWHTYTDCHFKTQIIASRASINPDDVADAVFGDVNGRSCFSTEYIIHDGEEVNSSTYNLDQALKSLNENSTL